MERKNSLAELYEAIRAVHPERTIDPLSMQRIYESNIIRRMLHWKQPRIDDVSQILTLTRGRVFAVRMDLLGEETGLKQPVVAGLIARSVARVRNVDTLDKKIGFIDGASVSTALAMG